MTSPIINYKFLTDTEMQILQQCTYRLTLSIDELTKPTKRRLDSDRPPRPQNSWILFRKDYEANLRRRAPNVIQEVKHTAQACSLKWQQLSSENRDFFKMLEKIAYENHKRMYPNYRYKPKMRKNSKCRKFIFREQKKYPFTSSPKPNSIGIKPSSPSLTNHSIAPTTINTLPSMINANSPTLPFMINDNTSLTIDAIHSDIVSTTIDASMTNVNSQTFPSTINEEASSLIGNNEIDNNILKIMPIYYLSDATNDNSVRNGINSNLTSFQSQHHYIAPTTTDTTIDEDAFFLVENDNDNSRYAFENMSDIVNIRISDRIAPNSTTFQPHYYDIIPTVSINEIGNPIMYPVDMSPEIELSDKLPTMPPRHRFDNH